MCCGVQGWVGHCDWQGLVGPPVDPRGQAQVIMLGGKPL